METPEWLNKANIKIRLDARPLLASGIHPLEQVIKESAGLAAGEIYEIITPFPPMPMIEKMVAAGFDYFSEQQGMEFHTCFVKK
ncbi:MAG: hypothetical protein NTU51_01260 [Bacteroidetes bacterium]|nr:hypothetical protein [Bacteroidota bacterium]